MPQDLHFAVLAEKEGYDKPLLQHNLSLTQLYEEIVIPYEEGKSFFIDGVPVEKTKLKKIKITQQTASFIEDFEQLHENVRFRMRDSTVFIPIEDYPNRLVALFRESGVDVTARDKRLSGQEEAQVARARAHRRGVRDRRGRDPGARGDSITGR